MDLIFNATAHSNRPQTQPDKEMNLINTITLNNFDTVLCQLSTFILCCLLYFHYTQSSSTLKTI